MVEVKIACVQMDICHCEKDRNVEKALSMVEYALSMGAEIIVLPEVFSTGFCYEQMETSAETHDGNTISRLCDLSKANDCVIVASIIEKQLSMAKNSYYNLGFCIEGGEVVGTYRKTHLFKREGQFFQEGNSIHPIRLNKRDLTIGLEICYEVRFPEVSRKLVLEGADLLVTIAEFPKPRKHIWRTLATARAIENQIPHIACNCTGEGPNSSFFGGSLIVDALGEVCREAGEEECVLIHTFDLDEVKIVRSAIPVFTDRKTDMY
ncbi:nitrilase-related carbon-nitrogen hydrolase [Methanolobus sp. ZRKC3]|uniref:nitrilase-related carbon-nitrogen hydrolase n=1 Tax=Methanolobus sp. ZRKC3 TaxID=3125786 RepID=UPI00324DA525